MSFRTSLAIALALGALGFMPKASASPYIVYSGKIATLTALESSEDTLLYSELGTTYHTQFTGLPVALQNKIHNYLTAGSATLTDIVYMVTDLGDVSNYVVVIVDPTGNKVVSTAVSGSTLTPAQAQNSFISGFKYTKLSSKGGLGVFRFGFSRSTGTDPVSATTIAPTTGSYLIQASAAGPIDDLANLLLVPARPAEKLRVVTAGVLKETLSLPAATAIYLPSNDQFISSMTGTVQCYYFDDTAKSYISAAATAGTLGLTADAVLTALANDGGGYVASTANIGWIPPIAETVNNVPVAPVTAFRTFVNNILAVYPKPAL